MPSGTAAVYNLAVKDCPEYFANGVLVHNCRYAVTSRLWNPSKRSQQNMLGFTFDGTTAPSHEQMMDTAQPVAGGPLP